MISLQAESLGKAYHIYARPIDSLKEWLWRRPYHETFWSLRDVSFTLLPGTTLGVVGENGAGKTTLLKLLAGTLQPSCGQVERHGRVSAILDLGSGFHPDLSGEENIRLGCAILGLSMQETKERLPDIVAFSELGSFIERPVRTYSKGMYLRLAFSVATSIEPDILVVDEHLSVGDQHFQKKCMDRMMAFCEQGKTLVFCSHALYWIRQISDQCLWLRQGRPEMLGPAATVVECYQDYERSRDATSTPASEDAVDTAPEGERFGGDTSLRNVTLGGDCHDGTIRPGQTLRIRVVVRLAPAVVEDVHIGLIIIRNDGVQCYGVSTEMDSISLYPLGGDTYGICFVAEDLPLLAGQYCLNVVLLDGSGMHAYDYWQKSSPFQVRHGSREAGVVRIAHRWEQP